MERDTLAVLYQPGAGKLSKRVGGKEKGMKCRKCSAELPDEAIYCMICGTRISKVPVEHKGRTRPNGAGTAYKRGNTWTAEYVYGWKSSEKEGGKPLKMRRTKGGFKTKREALEYVTVLRTGAAKKPTHTLESYWQAFESGGLKKLSKDKVYAYNKAHERMKTLMPRDITTVSIGDLQGIINAETNTYYPAKDIKNLTSKIYQLAMAEQVVNMNLSQFLTLPTLEETEQKPFNADEVNAMWTAFNGGDRFVGYILLMIYSGMMPGELMGLKFEMIDWEHQQITKAGLKTKKRKEIPIMIADGIVPVLQILCNESDNRLIFGINDTAFYTQYYAALERMGIERRTPYACRHTTGTDLALSGAAMSAVQKIMRHAKITTTQRYVHVDYSPMLEAINRLLNDKTTPAALPTNGQ